jgi:PPP family 3-phenylpropionic acid transporter
MIQPVYFFYFLSVGVSMPFFPPYLRGLGLSGRQIATILGIVPLLNLGLPFGWAWTADRSRRHSRVLSIACLGAGLGYLPMVFARSFPQVFVSYLLFALFAVGIGALMDSMAIARVRGGAEYGRIRIWGSVGFVASALGVGEILTVRGGRPADPWVPTVIATALLSTFAVSLRVTGTGEAGRLPTRTDVRALLRDRRLRLLLTVAPLHWMGCAPYNVFFGIFVRDRHLPPIVLGAALAAGVVAEMIVLFYFSQLRGRFSIESLLLTAFAGTALRWALMPLAEHTLAVVALQLFHGLTFGLFWGAGIAWIGDCVPTALRATGQSLFVMSMLGVGNLLGYWLTGLIYDSAGGVGPAFLGAAFLELVPLALVLRAMRLGRRVS